MFILVEGVDKSGKSSVISDIKKVLPNCFIYKNKIKPAGADDVSIGRASGIYLGIYQLELDDKIIVLDRSHLTEIVYSPRRGYSCLDKIDWEKYEQELLLQKAVVIYMTAPPGLLQERFKLEKEDYISPSEIIDLQDRYAVYLTMTKLPVLTLSSTETRRANLAKVIEFIAKQKLIWTSQNIMKSN